jgi:hypothetical protein
MSKPTTGDTKPAISRRTGLDRRWIPSPDHHPERRSGKDRRSRRKRAFLELIDLPEENAAPSEPADVDFTPASVEKRR